MGLDDNFSEYPGNVLITRVLEGFGKPDAKLWENIIDNYIDYDGIKFSDGYSFMGRNGMEKGIYKNFRINIKPDEKLFMFPKELK